LSGGLIGPDDTPRDYPGSFDGTPIFLGCSDVDDHIPAKRVKDSARILEKMGAVVTMRLYPGMGHLVNDDEVSTVKAMMLQGLLTVWRDGKETEIALTVVPYNPNRPQPQPRTRLATGERPAGRARGHRHRPGASPSPSPRPRTPRTARGARR